MADDYVCTLDEQSLKKAKEELNEDPADRMNAVKAFRNLIQTRAPHLKCSMDATFLLRFLRVGKFSQLEALNRLEKYLEIYNTMSDWARDIDMMDPKIQEFLDTGYLIPLGRGKDGQLYIICDLAATVREGYRCDKETMGHVNFGVLSYFTMDENVVVNGLGGLVDLTTFNMKNQLYWDVEDIKRFSKFMNGAWPSRFKNFYYYNHGPFFQVIFNIFYPMMSKKMKSRLHLCGDNMEAIYGKKIPMELLPREYLPDDYTGPHNGSVKDLIAKFKAEISRPEVVARIKYETGPDFRLDESKRPKKAVPLESYRKLNVD